jgi:TP901 family phage tail tape measure protein
MPIPTNFTLKLTLIARDLWSKILGASSRSATENLNRVTRSSRRFADEAGRNLDLGGRRIITTYQDIAFITDKIKSVLAAPLIAFSEVEDALTRLKVAFLEVGGVLPSEFERIIEINKTLGNMLPGSIKDMADLTRTMAEQGATIQELVGQQDQLNTSLITAAAFFKTISEDLTFEDAGRFIVNFSRNLGIASSDMIKFVDIMQRAHSRLGVQLGGRTGLAFLLKHAGPVFRLVGIEGLTGAKRVLQLAGALSQMGLKGQQVGTALGNLIIAAPSLREKLDKLLASTDLISAKTANIVRGFQFFKDGVFQIEQVVIAMDALARAQVPVEERLILLKQLFGKQAAVALAAIGAIGVKSFNEAGRRMESSADIFTKVNVIMDAMAQKTETLGGNIKNLGFDLVKPTSGFFKGLQDILIETTAALDEWVKTHPTLVGAIMGPVQAFAGISVISGSLSLILAGATKFLQISADLPRNWRRFSVLLSTSQGAFGKLIRLSKMLTFTIAGMQVALFPTVAMSLVLYGIWKKVLDLWKEAKFEPGDWAKIVQHSTALERLKALYIPFYFKTLDKEEKKRFQEQNQQFKRGLGGRRFQDLLPKETGRSSKVLPILPTETEAFNKFRLIFERFKLLVSPPAPSRPTLHRMPIESGREIREIERVTPEPSSISINFAPTINIQSDRMAKEQTTEETLLSALRRYERHLLALIDEARRKQERLSYGIG